MSNEGREDRHLEAIHESAHAVLWHIAGVRVKSVELGPPLGRTNKEDVEIDFESDESILRFLVATIGGPLAEAIQLRASGKELDDTFEWAVARDKEDIESIFSLSGRTMDQFQVLYTEAKGRAFDRLSQRWSTVVAMAGELERYGRLDGWRVRRIIHESDEQIGTAKQ
jgi:hypothetical protein